MISNAYLSFFNDRQNQANRRLGTRVTSDARLTRGMQPMCLLSISDTRRRVPNVGRIGQNLLSG